MLMTYKSTGGQKGEKLSFEITRDTINRHLSDINDKISEEDIRRVNTSKLPVSDIEEDDDNDSAQVTKDQHPALTSPWNILDVED